MALKAIRPGGRSKRRLSRLRETNATPYPGLRPFRKDEDWLFFGRERQIFDLLEILANSHFVSAIGPSGCGKSSLIRAGILPALETGAAPKAGSRWTSTTMRPGSDPFAGLIDALVAVMQPPGDAGGVSHEHWASVAAKVYQGRSGLQAYLGMSPLPEGQRLLLLIDQFEELFTSAREAGEDIALFVALLVELFKEPIDQLYIVITMRTDYIGDCTRFLGLAEVINDTFYLIPRLTPDELREAITLPAMTVGGLVESELVDALLATAPEFAELGAESDHLPLMQHVLMWMWLRAQAGTESDGRSVDDEPRQVILRKADYECEQVGRLRNALSKHAETILGKVVEAWMEKHPHAGWKEAEEQVVRVTAALFRQLVEHHLHRFIRRPVTVEQVIQSSQGDSSSEPLLKMEDLRPVIERFSQADCSFIDVRRRGGDDLTEKTELDIGHEALIRRWQRLQDWGQDEAKAGRRIASLVRASGYYRLRDRNRLDKLELSSFRKDWRETQRLYAGQDEAPPETDVYPLERLALWTKPAWEWIPKSCGNLRQPIGKLRGVVMEILAPVSQKLAPMVSALRPRRFVGDWRRRYEDVPNRTWAQRYLMDVTKEWVTKEQKEAQGQESELPGQDPYELAKEFWRESERFERRRYRIWSYVVPLVILLTVGAGAGVFVQVKTKSANRDDLSSNLIEGSIHAYDRDSEAIRSLDREIREKIESKELPRHPLPLGGWPFFAGERDELLSYYGDMHRLFISYADLDSVPADKWGSLSRENPWVPLGNAIHFRDSDHGDCVAVIDAIGQLSVTCNSGDEPGKAVPVRRNLVENGPVNVETFQKQELSKKEGDQVQVAVRSARIAYRRRKGDKGDIVAVSSDQKVRSCRLGDDSDGSLGIQCDLFVDLSKMDAPGELRGLALDESGRYVASIYRACGSGNAPCEWKNEYDKTRELGDIHFYALLLDLKDPLGNVRKYALQGGLACNFPADAELIHLRKPNAGSDKTLLTMAFDSDAYLCQWALPPSEPKQLTGLVKAIVINQGRRFQLDLSPDGNRALIGASPHFLRLNLEEEVQVEPRFLATRNLLALRFFNNDKVLSSNEGHRVNLSDFSRSEGGKRLLTGQREVHAFAPDLNESHSESVAYGVATCLGTDCGAAMDVLRWQLNPGDAPRFGRLNAGGFSEILKTKGKGKLYIGEQTYTEGLPEGLDATQKSRIREHLAKLRGAGQIKTSHTLPWGAKPRQIVVVTEAGVVSVFNVDPERRLFSLNPLSEANLPQPLFEAHTSRLYCPGGESEVEGCWLELDFLERGNEKERDQKKLTTLVYHFPNMLPEVPDNAR